MKNKWIVIFLFLSSFAQAWTHLGSNTYGWKEKKLTFHVNPTNCTLPESELYQLIDNAIKAWNGVPNSDLEISRSLTVATDGDAEFRAKTATQVPLILCSKQLSDYGSIDANTILGFVPYFDENAEGYVQYSGLVLNAQAGALAELSQLSSGEAELIIGHEMGHVLGLGHSGDPNSLMYFQLNKDFLLITQDDQDGIAHLYPRNVLGGALGCASVHQHPTQVPLHWLVLLFVFLVLCVVLGRVFSRTELLP
ncbi:MAG: matrixin family metalloprotease [Pseudomonadota bacterium]